MGIPIYHRPIEAGIEHFLCGEIGTMMSPRGSTMACLKNFNGFRTVNTPPDHLIRTDFEQVGVVSKIMLDIFKEFLLLLGRHPFPNEFPRMVIRKIGEPWGTLVKFSHTPKCLERKCIVDFLILKNTLMGVLKSRKVIGSKILSSFLVSNFNFEFLKEENPPH